MADYIPVRTLEDLRESYVMDSVLEYFETGALLEWLEERYYEEEAAKIKAIDRNDPDKTQKICDALGVIYRNEEERKAAKRLNLKKRILRIMGAGETELDNADRCALDQEDLSELIDRGVSEIYLCGDYEFSIPLSKGNRKYIGIFGTTNIKTRAKSQKELDEKGIVLQNVKLPWDGECQ